MAITYASSTITIAGGYGTGTASGGTSSTLVDSGIGWTASANVNRFVYIHTGTGSGQKRLITANTTDTLTVSPDFTTTPDGTSQYIISYNIADIQAADTDGAWGVTTTQGRQTRITADIAFGSSTTKTCFGDVNKELEVQMPSYGSAGNISRLVCTSYAVVRFGDIDADGLWRYGCRLTFDFSLITTAAVFYLSGLANSPKVYFYDCMVTSIPYSSAKTNYFYNQGETEMIGCLFSTLGGGRVFDADSLFSDNVTHNTYAQAWSLGISDLTVPISGCKFFNSDIGWKLYGSFGGTLKGAVFENCTDIFYVEGSSNVYSGTFNYIDCSPKLESGLFTFYTVTSITGHIYEKNTYNANIVDGAGSPVETVRIYAENNVPAQVVNTTTDASGDITEQTVTMSDWTSYPIAETAYGPMIFKYRKYGYLFQQATKAIDAAVADNLALVDNAFVVANDATAAAYTGISVTWATGAITVTGTRTIQELYDYLESHACDSGNIQYAEPMTTSNGTDFTLADGWSIDVTGSLTSTTQSISGTITVTTSGFYEDANGTKWADSGSVYYASHFTYTCLDGASPVQYCEVAHIQTDGTNRTYNTSHVAANSITSNASGVAEGYAVWKVDSTACASHNVRVREYEYQLFTTPKTLTGAPITENVALSADVYVDEPKSTVDDYTGIAINYSTPAITVTATHTIQKLYDYVKYNHCLSANLIKTTIPLATTNGIVFALDTDYDLIVGASGVLVEVAKSITYSGGALTTSSGGVFEDSTGAQWEDTGAVYYAKHVYRNVKDVTTSANQQYAVVACWDTDSDTEVTYNASRVAGGLTTDADGKVEGYYVYKVDATTYTLSEYIGCYGFDWMTVPVTANGTAIGSAASYETVRLVTDSYVTLTRANALLVSGITATHATSVMDHSDETYSAAQDNLKARQARTDDIEAGKAGYVSYYEEGHLFSYDGTFYQSSSGWIIQNAGFGGTLKSSKLELDTAAIYNILVTSCQINFEGDGTYDLRGATIGGTLTVDTINDNTVTVQLAPGTSVTNNDEVNITVEASVAVDITLNNLIAGSRVQVYDTDGSTEIDNSIEATATYVYENYTYTEDVNIRIRVTYVDGVNAYDWYTITGTITTAGFTANAAQVVNSVYEDNNVDGSSVTECSINANGIDIEVDDPDNTTTAQRIYNWYQYYLFTEDGIRDSDDYISATDQTHYVFDNGLEIKNLDTSNPLNITGANIVPTSGAATDIFDLTNGASIALNFNRVEGFAYSSGSGLSTEEHNWLSDVNDKAANIQAGKDVAAKDDVIAFS